MRPSWDQFTTKWGFGDGEMSEPLDFTARDLLVEEINKALDAVAEPVIVAGYDQPGLHNACMIVIFERVEQNPLKWHLDRWLEPELTGTMKMTDLPVWFFDSFDDDCRLAKEERDKVVEELELDPDELECRTLMQDLILNAYDEARRVGS